MCGLGLMGLPMFLLVGLLLLTIFGLIAWYAAMGVRKRLAPLPPGPRRALGILLAVLAVTALALCLLLARDLLVTGPCPVPRPGF